MPRNWRSSSKRSRTASLETKLELIEAAVTAGFADNATALGLIEEAVASLEGTLEEKLAAIEQAIKDQMTSLESKLELIEGAVSQGFTDAADKLDLIGQALDSLNGTLEEKLEAIEQAITDQTTSLETNLKVIETSLNQGLISAGAEVKFDIKTSIADQPVFYRTGTEDAWTDWSEYTSNTAIPLEKAGDMVQFKGDNAGYGTNSSSDSGRFYFTADCYVYGNIMSLVSSTDFSTCIKLTADFAFSFLFYKNEHLMSHPLKRLFLPATTLALQCYFRMFQSCSNLSSVKCWATDISAEYCTFNWLNGVSSTGTFITPKETGWTTDSVHGIPSGWTRKNIEDLP